MFKCIFIRRKLYDYVDNSLAQTHKVKVYAHIEICPNCRNELHKITTLIELAKSKQIPQPPGDFWHSFKVELDRKLNARLVPEFNFKPVLRPDIRYRLKPAFVLPLVSVFILALSLSLYFRGEPSLSIRSDADLIDEASLLEELTLDTSLNHDEDSYLEELNLLYQLDENLS